MSQIGEGNAARLRESDLYTKVATVQLSGLQAVFSRTAHFELTLVR
jgi:hypothetical protein